MNYFWPVARIRDKFVLGRYEAVNFPELSYEHVKAKVDTGAKSSAIHASNIREIKKDGKLVLRCHLLGKRNKYWYFEDYNIITVKSSNGIKENRYVVSLKVQVFKRAYKTAFTLSNRISMNFPVLLGRKFLRKRYVVDVSEAYLGMRARGEISLDKRYK